MPGEDCTNMKKRKKKEHSVWNLVITVTFCFREKCQSSFKLLTSENNIYQVFESTIRGFDVIL